MDVSFFRRKPTQSGNLQGANCGFPILRKEVHSLGSHLFLLNSQGGIFLENCSLFELKDLEISSPNLMQENAIEDLSFGVLYIYNQL